MITEPIALDKSLNTTGTSSKNIADVVQKGLNDIRNAIEGGSGGGGHIIVDQSGAEMPQEPNMTFKDAHLTDNPTGESTDIEIVKEVLPADYDSTTDEGIIVTDDGNDALIGAVSDDYVEVTADGNTTWIDILNYIFNHTDLSKITPNANLCVAGTYHPLVTKTNVLLAFAKTRSISSTQVETSTFVLQASNSHCDDCSLTSGSPASASITDNSANKPSNGAVITLYYGNKKAVVDLQTTANRCWMADGNTVANELSVIDVKDSFTAESCVNSYKAYKYGKFVILNVELKNQTYADGNLIITSKQDVTPLFTTTTQLVNASNKPVTNGAIWLQTTSQHRYFGDNVTGVMYFTAIYLIK